MTTLIVQLLVLQLLVPLALVGWLAFRRPVSRIGWAVRASLAGSYLAAVALAGLWLFLPPYLPLLFVALYVAALLHSRRGGRPANRWPVGSRAWVAAAAMAALSVFSIVIVGRALSARQLPGGPVVDLTFPLQNGTYYVVNGGSDNLLNAHLATLDGERFRAYRGQSHGVDLVKVGAWALRARGLAPANPADYAIFGEPVHAPCSGSVVQAVDGLVDLEPPRADREHMAGNHVVIACDDIWVLLAHFQNGSVSVVPGDTVATGEQVGRVGNTGNSDEPHLHIHAQRPGTKEEALSGDPLPIRLNGRYLVRNSRIEVGSP